MMRSEPAGSGTGVTSTLISGLGMSIPGGAVLLSLPYAPIAVLVESIDTSTKEKPRGLVVGEVDPIV